MNIKEIGIDTKNCVDLAQYELLERACECSIELPGTESHGVSLVCINCYIIKYTFFKILSHSMEYIFIHYFSLYW